MVELLYKILCILISPITWFWDNIPRYMKRKQYTKIVISLLLSLLLMAMIAFDIIGFAYIIIMFANNHVWLVCIISGIAILYWYVKQKHTNIEPEQGQSPTEEKEEDQLKAYARNGYRDMRLIIFKTIQAIGEALGMKPPRMLSDIESVDKFFINYGCVFYQFSISKEDLNKKFSDAELEDTRKVLEDTFLELWSKGEFPSITLSTYTNNDGVILPPVTFILVSDMGRNLEILVTFTTPASVEFLKRTQQKRNATNSGYDKDDSRLL